MKIAAWNIQQGGAKRATQIIEAVQRHAPDVLVLSELRLSSAALLRGLADTGWVEQHTSLKDSPYGSIGVLAKTPLVPITSGGPGAVLPGRWIEVWSPAHDTVIAGLYGPLQNEPHGKFWQAVRDLLPARTGGSYLVAGDFNTGESLLDAPKDPFFCSDHFVALRSAGLVDVWRARNADAREYSYFHRASGGKRGNGFRIDHLMASTSLAGRLRHVEYDATVLDAKTSDHAMLVAHFSA